MEFPSMIGSDPSQRVKDLKERFLNHTPCMCCSRAAIYTEIYQKNPAMPLVLKRAIALRETLSRMPIFIEPGEVVMGHVASQPRGAEVFPEINMTFMSDIETFETREYNRLRVTPGVKRELYDMWPYWKDKTLTNHFQELRPQEVKDAIASGLLSASHEWNGLAHVAMDYRKLLRSGVEGMRKEIERHRAELPITEPRYAVKSVFYRACLELCEGMLALARRYRDLALKLAAAERDPARRAELEGMAAIVERVPLKPAATFREAVQSFWFMQAIPQIEENGFSITPGRFDQYMWPYLERDLREGRIAMEEAQELMDMLFLRLCEVMRVDCRSMAEINAGYAAGQNLAVGGVDEDGNDATNPLSIVCLTANYHMRLQQPNFTVRLHRNTPKEFLDLVVESIGCGNGMPQIMNDELIIPSLVKHGIPLPEARDYIPVGCDEVTAHRHWGKCNSGYINFAKVLELTIGNGTDIQYGRRLGLDINVDGCETFGAFLDAFDRQLIHAITLQVCEANIGDHVHKQIMPLPFISLFLDDCLEKGLDVTEGGAHYNTSGLVGVGTATVADSLQAIRTMAFDDKKLSLPQYRAMLARDFAGDESTRQFIVNRLPKFGNDIDEVDDIAVHLTTVFFDELERHRNYFEGDLWPALYSVSAQIGLGNHTAATPDGRKAGAPLSDGLTPMYGLDVNGPTASLKSVAKIDQSRAPNGIIINQRLTRNLFLSPRGREKMPHLLRAFVDLGSFHWQFNIVDNETLRRAQEHPDEYRGLVVRVAGYSAIFVELSLKAQNSIIARYAADLA
ncbi:MAG: formate C-acetyltransferase/glycerol dehydratase family glycyl radical enzyme [Planctomycetota bacterium]|nr:formate C-acetyltransferase/glycerol dehydratase family glycyl radical enzyme [Planctomycetota bacterium]